MAELQIRKLLPSDRSHWDELWQDYLEFYEAELHERVTEHTWRNILENKRVVGIAALSADRLIGFANLIFHEATWSVTLTAYLEDLFVCPAARGAGVGAALLEASIATAAERRCETIYWHTKDDDQVARRLYDGYAPVDDFVRYRLKLA